MGKVESYRTERDSRRIIGPSDEFRRLRRAVEKAHGDPEAARRNVCRAYHLGRFEDVPHAARAAALALIGVGR